MSPLPRSPCPAPSATGGAHRATRRGPRATRRREALDAEDRERRRLAESLHDEAIQNLLARQDLKEAEWRTPGAIEHARRGIDSSVGQLRATVFDLHPYVLEHAGLAAVQAVAVQQG